MHELAGREVGRLLPASLVVHDFMLFIGSDIYIHKPPQTLLRCPVLQSQQLFG